MTKFSFPFLILICISISGFATHAREMLLGSGNGSSIIETADHNFIFTGAENSMVLVAKVDSEGNRIWTNHFGPTTGLTPNNSGASIIRITESKYLITGNYEPGTNSFHNLYAILIDSSGNEIWEHNFGVGNCYGTSAAYDSISNVIYLLGSANSPNSDIFLVKVDTSGRFLWNKYIDYGYTEYGRKIVLRNEQDIFILGTGNSLAVTGFNDGLLIETDSSGYTIRVNSYGGYPADNFTDIEMLADGFLILGNTVSYGAGLQDGWLLRLNNYLDTVWTKTFGTGISDNLQSFVRTDSNTIWYCGYSNSLSPNYNDTWILETDTSGNVLYDEHFGNSNSEMTYSIIESESHSIYAIGESDTSSSSRVYLIRLDSLDILNTLPEISSTDPQPFHLYPNPSNGKINIQVQSDFQFVRAELYNSTGKIFQVNVCKVSDQLLEINLPDVAGLYVLNIHDKRKSYQFKICKN